MRNRMKLKKYLKGSHARAKAPPVAKRKNKMVKIIHLTWKSIIRTLMKP